MGTAYAINLNLNLYFIYMNTEQRVLKQITDRGGKALIRLIARDLKMNNDHVRYLCKELLKKGLLGELEKKDWYEITQKGWKRMGKKPMEELPQKHENIKTQEHKKQKETEPEKKIIKRKKIVKKRKPVKTTKKQKNQKTEKLKTASVVASHTKPEEKPIVKKKSKKQKTTPSITPSKPLTTPSAKPENIKAQKQKKHKKSEEKKSRHPIVFFKNLFQRRRR